MKVVLGSRFWGLNNENSDLDTLEIVFPTLDNIFSNKAENKNKKEPYGDAVIKDFRLILKEIKNGSLKMVEMLLALENAEFGDSYFEEELEYFLKELRKPLIEACMDKVCYGCYCEAGGRLNFLKRKFIGSSYINKEVLNINKLLFVIRTWKQNPNYEDFTKEVYSFIKQNRKNKIRDNFSLSTFDCDTLAEEISKNIEQYRVKNTVVDKEKSEYFEKEFKKFFENILFNQLATRNLEEQLNEIEKKFLLYEGK